MALWFKEWGKVAQVFGLQPSSPQGSFPYQALCQDATYNHRELLTTGLYLNIWNGKRHLLRESSSTCLGLQAQGEGIWACKTVWRQRRATWGPQAKCQVKGWKPSPTHRWIWLVIQCGVQQSGNNFSWESRFWKSFTNWKILVALRSHLIQHNLEAGIQSWLSVTCIHFPFRLTTPDTTYDFMLSQSYSFTSVSVGCKGFNSSPLTRSKVCEEESLQ